MTLLEAFEKCSKRITADRAAGIFTSLTVTLPNYPAHVLRYKSVYIWVPYDLLIFNSESFHSCVPLTPTEINSDSFIINER